MNNSKQYVAINASAGSGKTYALVLRVLAICLRHEKKNDAIRHILALTFTNKAANEMKERILTWLKDFTKPDYENNQELKNIQKALADQKIHVSLDQLHERSQNVLDYILHNYSTLNIGTIDKFNARLVRSFSYELGLAHQFNLEIQSEPYLIEAVDRMLDEIGEDGTISEAFMDFIDYNLDNDEKININRALYRKAKQFISDIHYDQLNENAGFDWEAYRKVNKILRDEIKEHRKAALELAEKSLKLIESKGLKDEDFQNRSNGISAWFRKFLNYHNGTGKDFPFSGSEEAYRKLTASKDEGIRNAIAEIIEKLIENRRRIIDHHVQSEKKARFLSELLPLKINKEIQEKLNEIEEENDLVLLSKFNIIINENLRNEPSEFIYEKIGTKYQHFFFDEFQDTSKMQWQNILPLKEHTVHSDGHSFTLVGDPKQSIYRFRGGDSELMLDILNKKETSPIEVHVEVLHNNWRSGRNIVDFNNRLYGFISQSLEAEHKKLFSTDAEQNPQKKFGGRLKIDLTPSCRTVEDFYESASAQMHTNIQECLDHGFSFSDITILCRTGKEIKRYSQLLGQKKVSYSGTETYVKTISEKGLTLDLSNTLKALIEFLNWEIQPKNRQFLVKALYYLNQLGRIRIPEFSNEMMELLKIEKTAELIEAIEQKFDLKLSQNNVPHLNLYNYIEFYVHEFAVENRETDFLLNFLEKLYGFTQNAGMTVKDFIKFWEEEAHDESIQASENVDAINMMTIHAAKGLEFPVVFIPMKNAHKDNDFSEWLQLENMAELKSLHTKNFNKDLIKFDDTLLEFSKENTYRNRIDRLCTQYVATTRPVEQLFLYLEKPGLESGKEKDPNIEIYSFIKSLNSENLDSFDVYPEVGNSFRKQQKEHKEERLTMDIRSLSHKAQNHQNIKIATPSRNYQNTVESVRIGIFVHEILEKIRTENDIEHVLQQYILEGTITENEKTEIVDRILNVVRNEKYSAYFSDNLKILNEKEVMITEKGDSELYRIDRLIETPEGLIIIDFKTGAEHEKYEKQVETYRAVLEKTGRKVAGTEIVYV